jgi:AraC family transcriptional regulator, regulatory protein of adaptative response / methylated-DNA-[protein]-cysteine methyltransferase
MAAVIRFVEAPTANIDLPLDIRGTDFQRRVYREMLAIPFGQTRTFADIAAQVGAPKAVRAVGAACSKNPLEFAIPCHRVLRSDGAWAGGGAWGDRRQRAIVTGEAAAAAMANRTQAGTGEQ